MRFFLSAKAWHLFLTLFGIVLSTQVLTLQSSRPHVAIAVGTLILAAVYFGWLWAIAAEANRKLAPALRSSTGWMGIGLAYAVVYVIGALIFLPDSTETGRGVPGFIVPMHLAAMCAIFYALLFTAKRLVTLDRKQRVNFLEYSGPFFLLWFFPVGVWFIQPKVNKLLGSSDA